jgi:hypothetical protein
MRTESIGLVIALSLCLASCGQGPEGPKGDAVPQARPAKREKLGHRDQPVLEAKKASPAPPVLRPPVRPAKIQFELSVSIAARPHVQRRVIRTRCSSPPTVVPAEVL